MKKTFWTGNVSLCKTILLISLFISPSTSMLLLHRGPDGTCFEGGVFPAKLTFPTDYPLSPPKMQFTCEMFHPNSNLKEIFLQNYF